MIGFIMVSVVLAAGVYWLMSNITFRRQSDRYTYMRDEADNEYIRDNVDTKDETDEKA
jgi:hypothetical protein